MLPPILLTLLVTLASGIRLLSADGHTGDSDDAFQRSRPLVEHDPLGGNFETRGAGCVATGAAIRLAADGAGLIDVLTF